MATFKALSRGSQIVLVAGPLLFFSLFFTWQYVDVNYGRAGIAKLSMDGWDAWGLLIALLVLAIVVPAGTLFWFMVKAMARIQMPRRDQ